MDEEDEDDEEDGLDLDLSADGKVIQKTESFIFYQIIMFCAVCFTVIVFVFCLKVC